MFKVSQILTMILFISLSSISQEVTKVRFEQEANLIYIYYSLSGEGTYEIKAYCSQDEGVTWGNPLVKVSGDVGVNQQAGINKKITWDVLSETNKLEGNISFKIELIQDKLLEGPRAKYEGRLKEQLSTYGIPGEPNYEDIGGAGNGISYSLGGRGAMILHQPSYDSKEQGKVVVTIKVDRKGNVTSAVPGAKGTNVSSQVLWNLAKYAALQSKFLADSDAPEVQVGTITYNFIRF